MLLRFIKAIALSALAATLVACGGGAGDTTSSVGCAGTGYTATLSYGTLAGTQGVALLDLHPANNVPSGCTSNVTYAVTSGTLPAGLALNTSTGVITGTPTAATSTSFTVSMTVSGYTAASAVVTVSIAPAPSSLCAASNFVFTVTYGALSGTVGTTITALTPTSNVPVNCVSNAVYSVSTGTLPAGLSLNSTTGVISGTPTVATTDSFTVRLTVTGYSAVQSAAIATSLVNPSKAWTFMVYIAGDNNLAEFAIADLAELKAATLNSNVNIVVQIEKGSQYANNVSGNPGSSTYRGLINGSNTILTDIGNKDMSSHTTLSTFISWAKTNYPANDYAVVLWSHGGGWKADKNYRGATPPARGALADDTAGGFMSLADIRTGLTNGMGAGNKISVLAFDACLMGQYEVAYELRNVAHYLVASEELVPGPGMPYTSVVNALTSNPAQNALTYASAMTTAFQASYANINNAETTMSVTDLAAMDDVHAKVLDFASAANAALGTQASILNVGRANAMAFGGSTQQSDSIDLWRYADYVVSNGATGALATTAAALKTAITTAIKTNLITHSSMANAKGMAVYFPYTGSNYYPTTYTNSALSNTLVSGKTTWAEFLSGLYAGSSSTATVAGDFAYYITWTNPTSNIKADVDLAVLEPRDWAAPFIGSTSANGFLSADSAYSNQNFESYSAKPLVEVGPYDVFANLYGCTNAAGAAVADSLCTTQVTFCSKLGSATAFTCAAAVTLDRAHSNLGFNFYNNTNTYFSTVTNNATSPYWDWYYFGQITKNNQSVRQFQSKLKILPKRTNTPR